MAIQIGYTNIIKISQNATVATVRRNLCILFVTYKLNWSIILHLIFFIKFFNNSIFPLSLKRYCMYFNFQNKNFFVVGYRLRHHASPKHRVEATLWHRGSVLEVLSTLVWARSANPWRTIEEKRWQLLRWRPAKLGRLVPCATVI